jgi:hypothetical protein
MDSKQRVLPDLALCFARLRHTCRMLHSMKCQASSWNFTARFCNIDRCGSAHLHQWSVLKRGDSFLITLNTISMLDLFGKVWVLLCFFYFFFDRKIIGQRHDMVRSWITPGAQQSQSSHRGTGITGTTGGSEAFIPFHLADSEWEINV